MRLFSFICCCIFLSSTAQASVVRTPPLIQAVQSGHMPLIGQLIKERGAEVNALSMRGDAVRHTMLCQGTTNLPALKLLLDNGADANLADNDGNTPLDVWHVHENKEILAAVACCRC